MAEALAGVWRQSFIAPRLSEDELLSITPLLSDSGCAALGWWSIRDSDLRSSPAGLSLQQSYRLLRLSAAIHEREIKHVISLLGRAGVEPILVKGWAVARLYPDKALRPYGDIDLCVPPRDYERARTALECLKDLEGHYVDLHCGFGALDERGWDELYERSQPVDIGDEQVRVLGAEDHLRLLCLHLLRNGAWRPLWLCDVAVALESRPADFDWARCLGDNRLHADWVSCTIALAHHLLKADITGTPVAERAETLPRWLIQATLRQWSRCLNPDAMGMALPTLFSRLSEPREALREIYARWDNPVRATVELHGQFNDWPRLPYQLAALLMRGPEIPRQLRKMLTRRLALRGREREAASLMA